jgi:hypothetical protein
MPVTKTVTHTVIKTAATAPPRRLPRRLPRLSLPLSSVRRRAAAASAAGSLALVPELDHLVRTHVCPMVAECAGVLLGDGDPANQHDVVRVFYDLAAAYDIRHGEGYVLRALLHGDAWSARELCVGFDAYNAGLEVIRGVVDRLDAADAAVVDKTA